MLTATQLAERKRGLGGSDAAAALGLSPWVTPRELYEDKITDVTPLDVAEPIEGPLLWGSLLEPLIRQRYADQTGRVVRVPDTIWSERFPWMLAHLDGVTDCGRGLECKTARSAEGWGEPGTDEIPQQYLIQVQHCMIVTGIEVFDVRVLIGGSEERMYEVPADRELQELIVEGEHAFWGHVARREPPPVDLNAPNAYRVVRSLYRGTDGRTLQADEALEAWRIVMEQAYDNASNYKAVAEQAKAHLLWAMGDASMLTFADGRMMLRKEVKRKAYTVEASTYIHSQIIKPKTTTQEK
jgi:putative phage-type endonuclease